MSECKHEFKIRQYLSPAVPDIMFKITICVHCGKTRDEIDLESKLAASEQARERAEEANKMAEAELAAHCETEESDCCCDKFIVMKQRAEQAEAQAARYREALDKARGIADNFRDYGDALDIVEIIDSAIKEAPDENKG